MGTSVNNISRSGISLAGCDMTILSGGFWKSIPDKFIVEMLQNDGESFHFFQNQTLPSRIRNKAVMAALLPSRIRNTLIITVLVLIRLNIFL